MRRHKGHAVPGMDGSRMRGLRPWRVSVQHARGGLGAWRARPLAYREANPAPDAGPARGASATGSGTRAADPSLPIDTVAAKPVRAGSADALPCFYEPIVHLP